MDKERLRRNWEKYKEGVEERSKMAKKVTRVWLKIAIVCTGIGIVTLLFTP